MEDFTKIKPKISNVVTTGDLKQKVDITKFPDFPWGIYEKETYGGRCGYVHARGMEGKVTIFPSGKMISIGAKSVNKSIEQLIEAKECLLKSKLISNVKLKPNVRNMVAILNLEKGIPLQILAPKIGGLYEPEQFPALMFKAERSVQYLIFSTGKIVINGAKSENEVNTAAYQVQKLLFENK